MYAKKSYWVKQWYQLLLFAFSTEQECNSFFPFPVFIQVFSGETTVERIKMDYFACIFSIILIFTIPVKWILAAAFAAIVHEFGHAVAIYLTAGNVLTLRIRATGIIMEVTPMSWDKEVICGLAGPLASLLLVLLRRWIPCVSICGLIQGTYNLFPIYPLDGGRVFRALVCRRSGEIMTKCVDMWLFYISIFLLICSSIFVSVKYRLGLTPELIAGMYVWKLIQRKIPCKQKGS